MPGFSQKLTFNAVTSLRRLADVQGHGKAAHISLRQELARPDIKVFRCDRELRAGDVAAPEMILQVQSDGGWMFKGHVFDHGSIVGDDFTVTATMIAPPDRLLTAKYSGNVGHQTNSSWQQTGFDQRIKDHWQDVLKWGAHFGLHQESSISVSDGIGTVAQFVGVALVGYSLALLGAGKADAVPRKRDDGGWDIVIVPK